MKRCVVHTIFSWHFEGAASLSSILLSFLWTDLAISRDAHMSMIFSSFRRPRQSIPHIKNSSETYFTCYNTNLKMRCIWQKRKRKKRRNKQKSKKNERHLTTWSMIDVRVSSNCRLTTFDSLFMQMSNTSDPSRYLLGRERMIATLSLLLFWSLENDNKLHENLNLILDLKSVKMSWIVRYV